MKAFMKLKRVLCMALALFIVLGQLAIYPAEVAEAAPVKPGSGATYFTDYDNWGGGDANSEADDDMDVGLTNSTNAKYPVEFKIENVSLLPTKSAFLLVRANDVDEYKPNLSASGEWDRVYFSSDPSDIALGTNYTSFPWGSLGDNYKREIPAEAYLGALSGANEKWNTTVIPFDYNELDRISIGDNYVGITIHHYYLDTRTRNSNTPNTGWQMTIDWAQLIIDGGSRTLAELTEAGLKVENGKVTIDTSFIPKTSDDFSMEVNVIERVLENGVIIERNIGLDKKLFPNVNEGTQQDWNNIVLKDSGITPNKEYVVNVILFEDRGDGASTENYTNPGEAQHVVSFSTHDPIAGDFAKSGYRSAPTTFIADDFKDNYFIVSGNAPNGQNLQHIEILSLPDPAKGTLTLNGSAVTIGQTIPVDDLEYLEFVPVVGGFDGIVEFEWNGFNGQKYAEEPGKVTINSSPEVNDFTVYAKKGESPIGFIAEGGLLDSYIDPGDEQLEKVQIISLPDADTGKLVIRNSGLDTEVESEDEIQFADLDKLVFLPAEDYKGTVSFTWNAHDGLQYAKDSATATIIISEAPVVLSRAIVTELGKSVEFSAEQFNTAPYYVDEDGDPFQHALFNVPSNFADSGTLTYEADGIPTQLSPGESYQLTSAELDTLVFTPATSLTEGASVQIPWYGNDGLYDSEQAATITITYYGKPIAEDIVIVVDEDTAEVEITGTGSYNNSSDNISLGSIVQPDHGSVTVDSGGNSDLELIYTPSEQFTTGTDSFTYTVKNEHGIESDPATVTIHIQKKLNGWVGDKDENDPTVIKAIQGEVLKLSAISSHLAEAVVAEVDGIEVPLTLVNEDTWEQDGYKLWMNDSYTLPADIEKGVYTPSFKATSATLPDFEQAESNLTDNDFEILAPKLVLKATPDELIMDGESTSQIEVTLTHDDDTPIANVEIELEVLEDGGGFIDPVTNEKVNTIIVVTNAEGKASIPYETDFVMGVPAAQIPVKATVYDQEKGLKVEGETELTLHPFVNTPPVVQGLALKAVVGATVQLSADMFASAAHYTDADEHPFDHAVIELPANFANVGKLSYMNNDIATALPAGGSYQLTASQLDTLVFEPAAAVVDGTTVSIPWYGNDGIDNSQDAAVISIVYYNKPIADDKIVIVDEDAASDIRVTGSGRYNDETEHITLGAIATEPSKGEVAAAPGAETDLQLQYTPEGDFKLGTDSFTYTVKDERGFESDPATVTIHIQKKLNGWVGDKEENDTTIVKAIPGEVLKLSAISSHLADAVVAEIDGVEVPLTLVNEDTWEQDGYKQWLNDSYTLPVDTAKGRYTPTFKATSATLSQFAQAESNVADNRFEVLEPILTLVANPEEILGDGKSTTELTATLTQDDGTPIAGVEVEFTAPTDGGSFIDSTSNTAVPVIKAVTDQNGQVTVTYQSALIEEVVPQPVIVTAHIFDTDQGLKAEADITITYMPAAINGVLTEGKDNTPVANATVTVTLDLNNDGVIDPAVDFVETVTTDEQGAYHLLVPRGNSTYQVEITKNVDVNGTELPVTYYQKAKVGTVTSSGEEVFDSEKTVSGIVLWKDKEGNSSQLPAVLASNAVVFVKDAEGNYLTEEGTPISFPVSDQGAYTADGLEVGQYELEIRYEYEPGQYLVLAKSNVQVTASGEFNMTEELVDPFGTVTDFVTGDVIEDAQVQLYYADTDRNRNKGITPRTPVTLPELVGFEPNDNASPVQMTDENGFYAYMVYPETDYYLIITKPGYSGHVSPTISVEWDIVQYDIALRRAIAAVEQPYKPTLNLAVGENIVNEGKQSTIVITYKNDSPVNLPEGIITLPVPADAKVIDADGGTLEDGVLSWKLSNLAPNATGQINVVLEWPLINQAEKMYTLNGKFMTGNGDADFSVKVNVFSNRFEQLEHYRYILGYPDGEFKASRSMTRAELAAIVARLTLNESINYELPYNDIRQGHWATNYIKIATKYGFFKGSPDGKFRPDEPVTRAELATVMGRYLELKTDASVSNHFSDTEGHWAGAIIEALYANKFIKGYPNGTFKPNDQIVRVEAVTMINSMLYRGPLLGLEPLFPDMPESHWGFGQVQEATISHTAARNEDGGETYTGALQDNMQ